MPLTIQQQALKDELALPAYVGMTAEQKRAALNLANITRIKATMSGSEFLAATDSAEYLALTAEKKQEWLALCGVDSIVPSGSTVPMVQGIWTAGSSATIANLVSARNENISRAVELEIGYINNGLIDFVEAN